MDASEVVLRFLESVGRRSDAEFYLGLFRAEAKERFAAISVDASVARHATEAVVLDLRFLAALGLTPIVALGLFEPTDAVEHGSRIRRRLEKAGVPAAMVDPAPAETLADRVATSARAGIIPIVPYGAADDRFARHGALLAALATRKMIFLHRAGGIRQKGSLVPVVNLTTEFDQVQASRELSKKQHMILAEARRLVLERVTHPMTVAITSPLDLLHELFTVKGAGTLLRRGAVIARKTGLADVDPDKLGGLLASAFGRPPIPAFFGRPISRVYLEEGYRGAALMVDTPLGGYLTKFAVDREAQGEGMGRDLWQLVTSDYKTIFWRARPNNPIAIWYTKICDGLSRFADWQVFWIGLEPEQVPAAIAYARAQPEDIPAAVAPATATE